MSDSIPTWDQLWRLKLLMVMELRAVRRWYRHRRFATAQRKRLKSPATQPALFSPGEPGQIYIPRQLGVPTYIAAQGQKLPPHPYNAETPAEVAYLEAFKRTSS